MLEDPELFLSDKIVTIIISFVTEQSFCIARMVVEKRSKVLSSQKVRILLRKTRRNAMAVKQETLYIKGDKNIEVTKPEVTLGDILSMECSNQNVIPRLKTIKVMKMQEKNGQRKVISILKIIKLIHEIYPNMDVQNLGETDIIVTYEEQKSTGMISYLIKTGFTVVLTFTGAAFAIMTFNNDVSVRKLFSQIYQLMTGIKPQGSTILELSYSIGLTIGILLFFNHFGKKKFSVDPTPLEVQMRTYENEIQTTLVENASRKGKELDADTSNSNGSNRS